MFRAVKTCIPLGVLIMTAIMSSVSASRLVNFESDVESGGDREEIRFTFDEKVPPLTLTVKPWGLTMEFAGTTVEAIGLDVESDAEGNSRVSLERPGIRLESVQSSGRMIAIRLLGGSHADSSENTYRLGIGDVITVFVYRDPDLSGDYVISQSGSIAMPLVDSVVAAGLTEAELAALLRHRLSEFFVNPQVTVSVKSYESQFVYVTGAAARPGRVPVTPGMSLQDALASAGVALGPEQEVVISRSGSVEPIVVDASQLDGPGVPLPADGDVIHVKERAFVFISGEIQRPGKYPYTEGLTLLEALALAEGMTEWASKKDVRIMRGSAEAVVDELVDIKDVERRKVPDPELRPGDHVFVRKRIL